MYKKHIKGKFLTSLTIFYQTNNKLKLEKEIETGKRKCLGEKERKGKEKKYMKRDRVIQKEIQNR